jgi:hypothetical protein
MSVSADTVAIVVHAGASKPRPVTSEFIDAIQSVTVRQLDDGTSTFQLVLDADQPERDASDFPIISGATVATGNRLKIAVELGSSQRGLIDGVIVHHELNYDSSSGMFGFSVIGEDLSFYMRQEEKAAEWPGRSSAQIAREIIGNYAQYGLDTKVVTPSNDVTPTAEQWVRQQTATDLSFVRALGRQFGYVFATRAGKTIDSQSVGYWGPPPRDGTPLPTLAVEMGSSTNVISLDFAYDAAAAEAFAGGSRVDANTFASSAVQSASTFSLAQFATSGSLSSPLLRKRRFVQPNLSGTLAGAYADALAQTSARSALRARAVVDGTVYGTAVTPSSVVDVRGAGKTFDGFYYVERVDHTLTRGAYTQTIVMTREGVGSTT